MVSQYNISLEEPLDGFKSSKLCYKLMFWKRRRHVVAALTFFGFFNIYALRVNLSIAIVAMTQVKNVTLQNGTVVQSQEFDWDSKLQGYVLSSFFYGYMTTQLLGGWLSAKIGGKRVFGIGVGTTAICTLITPLIAYTSAYSLIALRVIEGIFEGVTFPCVHSIWSRWAPPLERGALSSFAYSGCYVGIVVAMPTCAYLAENLGWPSIFYVYGTIGVIWLILWWWILAETPAEDSRISKAELEYIEKSLGTTDHSTNIKHPWMSMMTSVPVWAIIVAHFCDNWGYYTLLTLLPKFMNDILDFQLGETGIVSAVPYLVVSITLQFSGHFADWFQVKGYLTTVQVRKIFNCSAFVGQTIFILATAYIMNPVGSVIFLSLAVAFGAFAWSGFIVNHLDVAPLHASVLMGISNTLGTIPGIVSPIIAGYIVTTPTVDEWRIVFYITAGVYLLGAIVYGLFASGEIQPWAVQPDQKKVEKVEN